MDIIGTRVIESVDKKRFIYVEVVRIVCLYLEKVQRVRTLKTLYVIKKGMSIQMRMMSSNEREPFFSIGGLKDFFISRPSHKKSKEGIVLVWTIKNASVSEKSLHVLAKGRTTPRDKNPISKGVPTREGTKKNVNL